MTDWLLSTLWYVSFVALIVAVLAVIRPLRWLRLRTRGRAVTMILVTLSLIAGTATCGPGTEAVFLPQTNLDAVAPASKRSLRTRSRSFVPLPRSAGLADPALRAS